MLSPCASWSASVLETFTVYRLRARCRYGRQSSISVAGLWLGGGGVHPRIDVVPGIAIQPPLSGTGVVDRVFARMIHVFGGAARDAAREIKNRSAFNDAAHDLR